ncbi:MAG: acyl carrier protein [Peptococcaceae bacterium]|nr:acyl carrier protein [Peptococcaceae bacterium]
MSTFEKVVEILVEAKDLNAADIKETSTWNDLGLDSLDTVELVMSVEDAFSVSLEMDETMQTVGDVVKAIDALK